MYARAKMITDACCLQAFTALNGISREETINLINNPTYRQFFVYATDGIQTNVNARALFGPGLGIGVILQGLLPAIAPIAAAIVVLCLSYLVYNIIINAIDLFSNSTFHVIQNDGTGAIDQGGSVSIPFEEVNVADFADTIRRDPDRYPYFYARVKDYDDAIWLIYPLTFDEAKKEVPTCSSELKDGIFSANYEYAERLVLVTGGIERHDDNKGKGEDYYPHFHPTNNPECHIWYLPLSDIDL